MASNNSKRNKTKNKTSRRNWINIKNMINRKNKTNNKNRKSNRRQQQKLILFHFSLQKLRLLHQQRKTAQKQEQRDRV